MAGILPEYEIFAIRYATRDAKRRDHFIMGDPHDAPMPMDYFVWVAKGPERTFIIDTGFTAEEAVKRKRTFLRCPIDALKLIPIDPDEVEDVILTHLHYDHVGNFHRFVKAQFHLQEPEIHYAVGRHMRHRMLQHGFNLDDIIGVVRLNYARRMNLYNGPAELAPGISIHPVGGHSAGLQFVRVHSRRGWVVLASDTSHFYENMESGRPFPAAINVPDMLEAFEKVFAAAPSRDHIIPGHDPEVMKRYSAPRPDLDGIVVRLDVPPKKASEHAHRQAAE